MSEVFPMSRLKEHLKALPDEEEMVSLRYKVKVIGQIECLALTVGAVPVECAALVVGECVCAALGAGWGSAPACPSGESTKDRNVAFLQQKPPFGPSDGGREGGREGGCVQQGCAGGTRLALLFDRVPRCSDPLPLQTGVYLSEQPGRSGGRSH